MKLFLVYLGGRVPKANIELHDVQFVAAPSIEAAYPTLRENWFGTTKGLHIDSYVEIKYVDGYRIELGLESASRPEKLFFVNCGGYDPESIAELHEFALFVATDGDEAKRAAKKRLLTKSVQQHKDDLFDVDDCFSVSEVGEYCVHLIPDGRTQPFKPDWYGYNVIG